MVLRAVSCDTAVVHRHLAVHLTEEGAAPECPHGHLVQPRRRGPQPETQHVRVLPWHDMQLLLQLVDDHQTRSMNGHQHPGPVTWEEERAQLHAPSAAPDYLHVQGDHPPGRGLGGQLCNQRPRLHRAAVGVGDYRWRKRRQSVVAVSLSARALERVVREPFRRRTTDHVRQTFTGGGVPLLRHSL